MTFTYPGVFHQNEDGSYEGYFPDLEDCTFSGETLDDAINDAIDAEKNWITVELEDEIGMPYISEEDEIELDEGEFVRQIQVIMHLQDGWDE